MAEIIELFLRDPIMAELFLLISVPYYSITDYIQF